MNTRHAVIDSPLGELTLVADGAALIGLYFRHHWYRPSADTFGPRVDPGPTNCSPRRRPSSTTTWRAPGRTST